MGDQAESRKVESLVIARSNVQCEVAVKELKAQGSTQAVTEYWKREVEALRMMNDLNRDHIVRFITAGQRLAMNGEEHHMMFG